MLLNSSVCPVRYDWFAEGCEGFPDSVPYVDKFSALFPYVEKLSISILDGAFLSTYFMNSIVSYVIKSRTYIVFAIDFGDYTLGAL